MGDTGVCCTDCKRDFRTGDPYAERLEAFVGHGKVLIDIVCVYCDLTDSDLHSEQSDAEEERRNPEQEEEHGADA